MHKLKWAIISTANIGRVAVIPAIQRSHNGQLLAVASRDEQKASDFASQLGIPRAYGSYQALLDADDVEAVYIPLPNSLHREWTIKAAEAGKHVLCEKPLALDASGYPSVAYYDVTNDDLIWAKWDGAAWSLEAVDRSPSSNRDHLSMALDSLDQPAFAYRGEMLDMKCARWDGLGWNIETVDSSVSSRGRALSLALDSLDRPAIGYIQLDDLNLQLINCQFLRLHL